MLKEIREGAIEAQCGAILAFACFEFSLGDGDEDEVYKAIQGCKEKNAILNIYLNTILSEIDLDNKKDVLGILKAGMNEAKQLLDNLVNEHDLSNAQVTRVGIKHYEKLISDIEAG